MRAVKAVLLLASLALVPGPLLADNLTGKSRFLCSAVEVTVCIVDGQCESAEPWDLNIPQFVVVDLDKDMLSTTEASGENRTTPIKNMEQQGNTLFLQGVENGRAFTFVIDQPSGDATVVVGAQDIGLTVFGVCTPMANN